MLKKNYLHLFFLLCFSTASTPLFAIKENKIIMIAYADYSLLLSKISDDSNSLKTIENLKQDYKNHLEKMQEEIDNLENNLSESSSSGIQANISTLDQKKIDMDIYRITQSNFITKKTQELLGNLNTKLQEIIAKKAQQLGFDIIVDSSLVMIPNKNLDLTNSILTAIPRK